MIIEETLKIDDYCACPSESQDWYRGLIRQIDSHGRALVYKIDYGDVQCIPLEYLRSLEVRNELKDNMIITLDRLCGILEPFF